MIKRNELILFNMYSTSRDKTSLTDIIECFETSSKKAGLPVLLKKEKIKAGVLWNKTLDECLVVIHPTHQDDYFSIVLKISRQGNYDFHRIYLKGKSVLFKSSSELQSYMSGRNIILDYKYKPFDPIARKSLEIKDEECNWYSNVLENL